MKAINGIILVFVLAVSQSCVDLDVRPNSSITLPTTVVDFERLLGHESVTSTPTLPHLNGDEHIVSDYESWLAIPRSTQRSAYTWEVDLYDGEENIPDWNVPYQGVFYCNSVLDHLDVIRTLPDYNEIKGWALFARAYLFYGLLNSFAPTFNRNTAAEDLGIPLRLTAAIDEIQPRSSVQECVDHIIGDVKLAGTLLSQVTPSGNRNRPSKTAVFAFLARIYLDLGDYEQAEKYASEALGLFDELLDYNTLDTQSTNPFTYNSPETIYFSRQVYGYITNSTLRHYRVNPEVVNLYETGDLRKLIYFNPDNDGRFWIKPINTLIGLPFTGLAVDELYLIKAECLARKRDTEGTLVLLNLLAESRFKNGLYTPMTEIDPDGALDLVLLERRRALVYRCQRWADLKRLNREGYGIHLVRELNGVQYTLPPNDPRYVFPIPESEIAYSGIQQNIRSQN